MCGGWRRWLVGRLSARRRSSVRRCVSWPGRRGAARRPRARHPPEAAGLDEDGPPGACRVAADPVQHWREWFAEGRVDGLRSRLAPGRSPGTGEQALAVVAALLRQPVERRTNSGRCRGCARHQRKLQPTAATHLVVAGTRPAGPVPAVGIGDAAPGEIAACLAPDEARAAVGWSRGRPDQFAGEPLQRLGVVGEVERLTAEPPAGPRLRCCADLVDAIARESGEPKPPAVIRDRRTPARQGTGLQ